jgi:hypothetical protein
VRAKLVLSFGKKFARVYIVSLKQKQKQKPMQTFLGELCTPAGVYLGLSMIFIFYGIIFMMAKKLASPPGIFFDQLITFLFVVIWTYILNFLCNRVSVNLVWILVIINVTLTCFSIIYLTQHPEHYVTWMEQPPSPSMMTTTTTTMTTT